VRRLQPGHFGRCLMSAFALMDSLKVKTIFKEPNQVTEKYRTFTVIRKISIHFISLFDFEMCHPRCVSENWRGYVVIHNYVN